MDNFGFPSNIKQIGNLDDNMRIYIEDNVYSYLLKYAECNKNRECLAMLIGRCMVIEDERVLFINGAIEGKYSFVKRGLMTFSEQSILHINEQKETYFKGFEIVGWVISQPCFGNFLSGGYAKYHLDNFKKSYQVLFVTDPIEKIHSFFTYNNSNSDIEESKGFFIYYDKNKDMENYIKENELEEFNEKEVTEVYESTENKINIPKLERDDDERDLHVIHISTNKENNENAIKYDSTTHSKIAPKVAIESKNVKDNVPLSRKKLQDKHNIKYSKKFNNMFATISFLLFVSAFALGSNLLDNARKINSLTQELNNVKMSYNDIVTYINNQNSYVAENEETIEASGSTVIVKDFGDTNKDSIDVATVDENITPENIEQEVTIQSQTPISLNIPDTYVVEGGDNLLNIALTFYGTEDKVSEIMSLNGIDNPDKIYTGMVLQLP
ncbi:MAG: LysM peptidoglycan-binding domain-containing protein [Lachnospirales bacterium]